MFNVCHLWACASVFVLIDFFRGLHEFRHWKENRERHRSSAYQVQRERVSEKKWQNRRRWRNIVCNSNLARVLISVRAVCVCVRVCTEMMIKSGNRNATESEWNVYKHSPVGRLTLSNNRRWADLNLNSQCNEIPWRWRESVYQK